MKPLAGIRILDFTWAQQGPYATVMLSDMGAEIIKVEHRHGERGRWAASGQPQPVPYFVAHDRGKNSVTLDVRKPEARAIVMKFVERVDVVVSNMRPGAMAKLGLAYGDLRTANDQIIYARASTFGPNGERTTLPGNDIIGQANGGIMTKTGPPGSPPMPAGAAIADQIGAMHLCTGILGALVHRERHGEGCEVDVSLYGSQIALQAWEINTESMLGETSAKVGSGHPLITPRGVWRAFETGDGHIVLGGVNTPRFQGLCEAMGLPDLADAYPSDLARAEGIDDINTRLEVRFREEPTDYWLPRFEQHDVIGAAVQSYGDILRDPQARANGYVTPIEHPHYGQIAIVGSAIQYNGEPTILQGPPPELGGHTETYLEELGYGWDEIRALREAEVI